MPNGSGVGRKLFDHCLSQVPGARISNFSFVTSPKRVKGFMGEKWAPDWWGESLLLHRQ